MSDPDPSTDVTPTDVAPTDVTPSTEEPFSADRWLRAKAAPGVERERLQARLNAIDALDDDNDKEPPK